MPRVNADTQSVLMPTSLAAVGFCMEARRLRPNLVR